MASTYSTSFRFELPADGEQAGTWGQTVNTNIGTLLEEAIGGYVSVTHDDSASDALTSTNGAADEARNRFIKVIGTLGANRILTCPDGVETSYIIWNATSGGFTVEFTTTSGTGVTIPNGAVRMVWVDGTNVVDAIDDLPTGATVNGTAISVTGHAHAASDVTSGTFDDARIAESNVTQHAAAIGASAITWSDDQTYSGADILMADNVISRPELTDYSETVNAIGSIGGGSQDINLTLGNVVTGTVDTSETTFTFSNPSPTSKGCSFTLILTNGGSQTVNWPASVNWAGGTEPTLTTSGVDILTFVTVDAGTTWYGFPAGLDMS